MVKIRILSEYHERAAELAATMNLHLNQWEWVYADYGYTWADCQRLFDRIEELEYRLEGLEK